MLSVGTLGFYLIQRFRLTSFVGKGVSKRPMGRKLEKFIYHLQEFDERLVQFYTQKRSLFFGAMGLNLLNWYLGALEIYIILYFLGHPISIAESIILETFVEIVRAGTFFIPGTFGESGSSFFIGYGCYSRRSCFRCGDCFDSTGSRNRMANPWFFSRGKYSKSPSELAQGPHNKKWKKKAV
ncbi:MAG: hypothetical protein CM1200mP16_15180 [Nitrospina sp.]|nr:MAG: hypothetical protein CM1200mP16_15180 [Nitrospina sp.]